MQNVQDQIQQLVRDFADKVTALAKETALNTLMATIGSNATVGTNVPGARKASLIAKAAPAAPAHGKSVARGKGEKRSPEELEALRGRLLEYIKANPGQRIEEINAAIGTTTSEVQRPIKHLVADGALRTEGQLRATRYYPSASSSPKPKRVKSKKPSSKKSSGKKPGKVDSGAKKASATKAPTKKHPKKATKKVKKAPEAEVEAVIEPSTAVAPAPAANVIQKDQIEDALKETGGKVKPAAVRLGVPESTLRDMIKRLGITRS